MGTSKSHDGFPGSDDSLKSENDTAFRDKKLRLGKNAIYLFISFAVLGIAQFGTLGLISRFGGVALAGIWAYAMAFRDPFLAFMDFGTTRLLVAEIARRRDESDILLGNGITLGLIVGLPVLGVMMLVANMDKLGNSTLVIHAIYLAGIAGFLFTTAGSFRSAFRAFNRFKFETIISVITSVINISSAFIVLFFDFPFIWLFVGIAFSQGVALIASWWIYNHRLGYFSLQYHSSIIYQILRKTWPFTMVGLFSRAFQRIDILILTFFHGASVAGFYALATIIFYQLNTLAQLVSTAVLPTMSYSYARQKNSIRRQLDATIRIQMIVSLPCTVIGLILAPKIIYLLYGRGYQETVVVFQLLVTVITLRFASQTLGVTLTAMDQQFKRMLMLGITVILNIGCNFLLIPVWSILGATVVAMFSEIVLFVLTYLAIAAHVRKGIQWKYLLGPVVGSVALVPFLFLLLHSNLLILLPFSGFLYLFILVRMHSFTMDETEEIGKLIERLQFIPLSVRKHIINFMIKYARNH